MHDSITHQSSIVNQQSSIINQSINQSINLQSSFINPSMNQSINLQSISPRTDFALDRLSKCVSIATTKAKFAFKSSDCAVDLLAEATASAQSAGGIASCVRE